MRLLWLGLVCVALPACAAGNTGFVGETGADGGHGGGHDDDHDAGPADAGALTGDALPPSAVSFFQGANCPTGWVPYVSADGRFLVPTVATAPAGLAYGTPLDAGEDRTHTHDFSATFTLSSTSYAGIVGGGNGGVGPAGAITMTGTSDPASTGLPYVQLLTCRKNAPAVPRPTPLPKGLQMFFDMSACPVGWAQTAATQGRLIVGLPQGAPQDVTFGGETLSSTDGGADARTHAHGNTATLVTTSHGIALASGCCGGGYAENGTYTATQDTAEGDTGLPYLELLQCEKQ
jgi:hypothetical protein